jgi:poly-gamma-glutamate synthesis protein (capsule biosynthesis protein)
LTLGSVEAVNLANNHTQDYGETGFENTLKALDGQGIAYAGNEWLCIFQVKGAKIGLAGITGSLTQAKKDLIVKQIALLREAGCQVIIYSLHAGQEYVKKHNGAQRNMARFLIDAGADAVAGHHPHVVQGVEIYKDRPIFYSLGNCVFGGNTHPKEPGALAVSITFSLEQGKINGIQTSLHPIYITGSGRINDYRPQLLKGKQADAVIKQVQHDTTFTLPPYREGEGSQLALIPPEQ